ncbi:hypothetical protein AX15_007557 [Amanita polypyramis BW_CC]|nr:hypothetical protein AX15_007557 [Amanita polypyramis BW_CC]
MDKLTSVIAALHAGKLPTTHQLIQLIDWVEKVVIVKIEPSEEMVAELPELSAEGKVLAKDLREVLENYKALVYNKNHDNVLQEAIWHLSQGVLEVTGRTTAEIEQAKQDMEAIRNGLQTLVSVIWISISTEGTSLFRDFASFTRLALAEAAELVEGAAGRTKQKLREQERGFQEGERDVLGREEKRLEEEKDIKVAWEHGMETVKEAGSSAIDTSRTVKRSTGKMAEKTESRVGYAYEQICDRAQADPSFKEALDTVLSIIQRRLNHTLDTAADPNVTLASFIDDPTPEKHIHTTLQQLCTVLERLTNKSLEPFLNSVRVCVASITSDRHLRQWFNDFFDLARRNLGEPGYARSEESRKARESLHARWENLLEGKSKWKTEIDNWKQELDSLQAGIDSDSDLIRLRKAHEDLSFDLQQGFISVGAERAQVRVTEVLEQVTWFWEDVFRIYIPQILEFLKDIPVPRTEYKDEDIEFVLENLDISSLKLHPSHAYLRNVTDVDITTLAPHAATKAWVGTLTHIRLQALQLALDDVSFWYRDKKAMRLGPKEFTGLLTVTLPEKGVDVNLKIKLIPANVKGSQSREALNHFHTIEKLEVRISDDVGLEVKESDHPITLALFRPLIMARLRNALEKSLTEELGVVINWLDGVAYDVGKRMEVFEDTGIGKGSSLMVALWSEVGRLQREGVLGRGEMEVRPTGTGVVVEHYETSEEGEREKRASFAMGAEPQILSGKKRGPLGTGSEGLKESTAAGVGEGLGKRAEEMARSGRRRVLGFKRRIEVKAREAQRQKGWQSEAFEVA